MNPTQAFALLGLAEAADESTIKDAYRRLSFQKHPDRPGGDSEEQSQLNEAYAVALSVARQQSAIALRAAHTVERVEAALLKEQSARQADGAARGIRRLRRRNLDRLRNLSLLVGLGAGVLFLFADYLFDPLVEAVPESARAAVRLQLGAIIVVFGGVALWMQVQVQRLENAIETCMEEFSRRRSCAEQLARALKYQDTTVASEAELERPTSDSFVGRPMPLPMRLLFDARVTEDDVLRILVPKAVEHGLLAPLESESLEFDAEVRYRVLFRPSAFKPKPTPPPEPPKPMTRQEARGMVFAGVVGSVLFGGVTTYLVVFHRTWWAVLPGLVCFPLLVLATEGLRAWFVAIRRESSTT